MDQERRQIGRCHVSNQQIRRSSEMSVLAQYVKQYHISKNTPKRNRQKNRCFDDHLRHRSRQPDFVYERHVSQIDLELKC